MMKKQQTGKIGYACTPISIPYRTSRKFLLRNFSKQTFMECTGANLHDLLRILQWNVDNGIHMFRISSDIIPFASHPINLLPWWDMFQNELLQIGSYIKKHHIRVSMHPGQYTVLNSPNEDVLQRSLAELEYHCRFLDCLGVDYTNKMILHIGGEYGDKEAAMKRFADHYSRLSMSAQKRLIIENDDKIYTIDDVLQISSQLNIPVVFDNLHHALNPCNRSWNEALQHVATTWKEEDGKMKLHYSDQDVEKRGGAHAKSVVTTNFIRFYDSVRPLDADVMLEVKDKELSAIKCICALDETLSMVKRNQQWKKYKYSVMEKSDVSYQKITDLIDSDMPMSEVYQLIDNCLQSPFDATNFIRTARHIYGFVSNQASEKEQDDFQYLLANAGDHCEKIKGHLKKLCSKYDSVDTHNSYYFLI